MRAESREAFLEALVALICYALLTACGWVNDHFVADEAAP